MCTPSTIQPTVPAQCGYTQTPTPTRTATPTSIPQTQYTVIQILGDTSYTGTTRKQVNVPATCTNSTAQAVLFNIAWMTGDPSYYWKTGNNNITMQQGGASIGNKTYCMGSDIACAQLDDYVTAGNSYEHPSTWNNISSFTYVWTQVLWPNTATHHIQSIYIACNPVTVTPVVTYCQRVNGGESTNGQEVGMQLPIPIVGPADCTNIGGWSIDTSWLTSVSEFVGIDGVPETLQAPGFTLCTRELRFGNLDLFGLVINIDTLFLFVAMVWAVYLFIKTFNG
jgi:hypothetical protein